MRRIALVTASLILWTSTPSFGQDRGPQGAGVRPGVEEWIQYASRTDLFAVNFPGEPKVQDVTYTTEFGIGLPGRVYSAGGGASRYSVTVVDYTTAEKLHTERAALCRKNGGEADACQNDWRGDVQGSIVHASWTLIQRSARVTFFGWSVVDQVEGQRLHLTGTDGSRTFAEIHRHGTRLYILEGTVPRGDPEPGLFQQSLMFLDEAGVPLRYRTFYTTGYSDEWKFPAPPPPRAR